MNDSEKEANKEENEIYLYLRKKLDSIKEENERILGRNTLVVAGGAFTLSVTLLKDLYPNPLLWTRYFLVFSWIIFGLCAFLQIYSDHLSSKAVDIQRKNLDDYYLKDMEDAISRPNQFDQWVRRINEITHFFLVIGFISMIVFCSANFLK